VGRLTAPTASGQEQEVQAITLIYWMPGSIWALFVVNSHLADLRNREPSKAIERSRLGK
jgi:hypothetical protein